jgi:hypothetical protein
VYAIAVVALVAILVSIAVLGGLVRPSTSSASPRPSGELSPLDAALAGIDADGTFSRETALRVFAAAFGPLPGVPEVPRDRSYHSGTAALQMVLAYWSELSDEQRSAVRRYIGPAADQAIPPYIAERDSTHLDALRRANPAADMAPVSNVLLAADYQGLAEAAAADIASHVGHPLGIPITTVLVPNEDGDAWAWATGNWSQVPQGSPATACIVSFPPSTVSDTSREPYLRWLLLHEVWHCFEGRLVSFDQMVKVPKWISEGEASWVAEAITGGAGQPPPELDNWSHYLLDPAKSLYARAYDAVGFWAQLGQAAIDPWTVLEPAYAAGAGGSDPGFVASGAGAASFVDRWGSSWFRDGSPSAAWAMTSGYGILAASIRPASQFFLIGDGDNGQISAEPQTAAIADIHATAFVTRFQVPVGSGRVGELRANGLDRALRGETLDVCTNADGDCRCPSGDIGLGPTVTGSPQLRAAATGEQGATSIVQFQGFSKEQWCGPAATPGPPCRSDCGGSNGDPHLRTIDGHRYDFQVAGEYVLLRSADRAFEVQARQVPGTCGPGSPDCNVSINAAVAIRVNGHRLGFYATTTVPAVKLDGADLASADVAGADLGGGATLTAYKRGYQLALADGTLVWALSVGSQGINLMVRPSAALRPALSGVIGPVPEGSVFLVPALPDGSLLPAPLDRHDRWHLLYEVFGPAWRVTAETSLFDYDAGQSTDSFTVVGFPRETAPLSSEEVDPAALAVARTACGAVSDPDLADQCAFDVATTGSAEYVTLYTVTDDFQQRGPIALEPIPASSPTPGTGGGGVPTGIVEVADRIGNQINAALGPDGTVYVEVAELDAPFDLEPTYVLLAVDGGTGATRQRVELGVPEFTRLGGRMVFAAGSLWAAEFKRDDSGGCQISRLDPRTLAEAATVATVCFDGRTLPVALDDEVWFVDPTGAGTDGAGAHLRRIDPATNHVDTSVGAGVELPFASTTLGLTGGIDWVTTSAGVIYGDSFHGVFRINPDASIDALGKPGTGFGFSPAGRGVWTQTVVGTSAAPEGTAELFTGGAASEDRVRINGRLVAADDDAVYASFAEDEDQADGFWRFPIGGGSPERLAVSGFVSNGFGGQLRLLYRDVQGLLLIGDGLAVKLWIAPSDENQVRLLLQAIPLP